MKQEAMQPDIRALMKLPAGRRVVWRLLEQAGVWRSVFSPEPLRMAFAEGQRNLGLWLLDWVMRECPDEYDLMMRETRDER